MGELSYWLPLTGRRLARRRLLSSGGIVAAGVGLATLAGCGSRTSGGKAPASASSGSGAPQKGGVLVHWSQTDPQSLDIHSVTSYVSVWPETPAYNQLLQYDPNDPDKKIIPDLADSYEVAGDGKSVVFKLHPGVKFHDGSELGSEDVKATLEWIANPPPKKVSVQQGVVDAVDHVETPDPLTAKVILTRPNPSLILNLATHFMAIGSKADLAKGDLGTQMNGTGPFKLKGYSRGIGTELERNPDYWIKDRPYLDGLKFSIIPEESTAFTEFVAGKLHRYFPVQPDNMARVEKETGGKAKAYSLASPTRDVLFFNGTKKPYTDARVRQAVSLVIDRQSAIQVVRAGLAAIGGYMQPGGQWAISADQLKKVPGYDKPDIAEAKKLLSAAGVTEPLSGTLMTRNDLQYQAVATFVQGSLQKALGWNFTLDIQDSAGWLAKGGATQFDMEVGSIGINLDDPDATFSQIATTKAARNWSKIYDAEGDALFEKQSQTLDIAQRRQLVQQMELKYLNDFGALMVFFGNLNHGIWNSVQNYKLPSSLYTNQRLQDVWLSTV
jgi:peptide/nickel transport system substrate-binding protein